MRRATLLLLLASTKVDAHPGETLQPHDLWTAWEFDPGVLLLFLLTGALYTGGVFRARVSGPQLACFWSGWIFLTLCLISPLHALGEVLFSAHMVQHEILMLVAAPLLFLSRPLVPMIWSLPLAWRRRLGRWFRAGQPVWRLLTAPMFAWWIHAIALWIWHIPSLFEATLKSNVVQAAQHLSFFGTALLLWWSLIFAHGKTGYAKAVLYIFTTAIHTSILGALLTSSQTAWYRPYRQTSSLWGLDALQDQQLGGLIMWVPAGVVYVGAGLALLAALLRDPSEKKRIAELENRCCAH